MNWPWRPTWQCAPGGAPLVGGSPCIGGSATGAVVAELGGAEVAELGNAGAGASAATGGVAPECDFTHTGALSTPGDSALAFRVGRYY